MSKHLLMALSLFAASVQAASPQYVNVVYDLYRNGYKFGQVTDTLTREGQRYTLVSETRASGPLRALWPGNIRLESEGVVTPQGLQPAQFIHGRSDAPHKLATTRLDWETRTVAYQYKQKSWQVNGLEAGAQDQLSQIYQFMFAPRLPADLDLQVVSRRDLKGYRYVRTDGGTLTTPLGALATQQFQRITQQSDDRAITVWVAPAHGNLPVQIRVSEDGVTLEQRLLRASIKD